MLIIIINLSNCLIRCVCKKSFLSFSYFPWLLKKYAKFVGNSQSFAPSPLLPLLCVAIFIILESQSEKLWDQNYNTPTKLQVTPTKLQVTLTKLCSSYIQVHTRAYRSYAHKTTSYAHKTTSYEFKTYKFDS